MKSLFLSILLITIPCALFGQTILYAPDFARQGEPIPFVFTYEPGENDVILRLYAPDGTTVAEAGSFPVPEGEGASMYACLLGVPSTAETGWYSLVLSGKRQGPPPLYEKKIQISWKQFLREDISLSYALSELRTSEDPRKVEESLELLKLLKKFEPESYFHDGKHISPLPENRETASFGDRRKYLYTDEREASAIHNGVDLAAPIGTQVYASGSGKIVFAGTRVITGNSVVIEHLPGFYGLYYHLDSLLVETGEVVRQGDVLGTVGMTGLATGPHLHWELRAAGIAVNPITFLEHPLIDKERIIGIIDENL